MRILFAEDEKQLSDALCVLLRHNGFTVDAVYNGQDAFDYLVHSEYDGAILDIMMPIMDGITTLKKIREMRVNTPVLMLTAKGEIDDKVAAFDAGADDYLVKPFSTKELLARLRSITRRREAKIETDLRFGNITLNPSTFEITSSKSSVRLANKEYQIMERLLMNSNSLISTERLMELIWGYDSEAEINVVWVYISALRKKLQTIEANVTIKAIRGLGYTLELCE